jgi:hypothetical protein
VVSRVGEVEIAVVILVVGARLLLPLAIPYYPIPGALACLVLDSIDQSIFQQFPSIPLDGYQSYDKALDVYYLTVEFTAMMRNWTNRSAYKMGWFLYFYRMIGVILFELTQVRAVLFIFPNTFEYFFVFYELVRLRWNPRRMGTHTVVWATALIWVFIKLPQEWWIHIAQLDMTDFIKEEIFGVDKTASWSEAVSARPEVIVFAVVLVAGLVALVWWLLKRYAPRADYRLNWRADPLPIELQGSDLYSIAKARLGLLDQGLVEKAAMVAIVSVVFALFMSGGDSGPITVALVITAFVIVNAFISQLMARRGRRWRSIGVELAAMAVVNLVLVLAVEAVDRYATSTALTVDFRKTLFFVWLVTLLTVLYDRFHTIHVARHEMRLPDST